MEFVPGKSELFCERGVSKLWPVTSMWTDKDVHDFVCDIGHGKYAKCFLESAVNGRRLLALTPFDLQRMGVNKMQDALHLHASLQATAHRMWYSLEDPHNPPNISYSSTTRGNIVQNPKLPPHLQPKFSSAFHPRMPPVPGHPYHIDWRRLCMPFRQPDDSSHACCFPPRQPLSGQIISPSANSEDLAFYSSHVKKHN